MIYVLSTDLGLCRMQDCERLAEWQKHVSERPSVGKTCVSGKEGMDYPEFLLWVYARYANGTALSTSAADFR